MKDGHRSLSAIGNMHYLDLHLWSLDVGSASARLSVAMVNPVLGYRVKYERNIRPRNQVTGCLGNRLVRLRFRRDTVMTTCSQSLDLYPSTGFRMVG